MSAPATPAAFSDFGMLSSQLGGGAAAQQREQQQREQQRHDLGEAQAAAAAAPPRAPAASQAVGRFGEAIPRVVDETAEQVRIDFEAFIENFEDPETGSHVYINQIKHLEVSEKITIYIDFSHLAGYNEILAQTVATQFYRMEPYLRKAVQNLVRVHAPSYLRLRSGGQAVDDGQIREFWIGWYGLDKPTVLRQLRLNFHGQLQSISGTVTRTSEVRPELLYGSFICNECGSMVKDVEQEFKYTEPATCFQPECGNRTNFALSTESSKFVDWQKLRLQESSNEVPSGAMPRSIDVILRNEMVERAKAGDRVIITGTPIVVPDVAQLIGNKVEAAREDSGGRPRDGFGADGISGLKALGARELTYRLVFLGTFVQLSESRNALNSLHDMNATEDPTVVASSQFSDEQLAEITAMAEDARIFPKLASSVAPHIYGHEGIKKGLLLQMVGGVHKSTPEGIRLRGDINVCVVGDPSTAKSQFLKYVSGFMPRAIYTSGKASSAAGLTASVVKDEETGEFTIEAGALMLADNGICCIDEFDKMDISDQVAIHEAMEQQTISIAKAGIQATLNARTSILAAANPVHGRYDKKLSLKQNVAMSPPIMSRFDLFFVILDECHEQTDLSIAQHIVNFHRFRDEAPQAEFTHEQLKNYLTYARALKPKMTVNAREKLVSEYKNLRQADATGVGRSSYRITVRQLESMVRLSEALAKIECSPLVLVEHVTQAAYLLKMSIVRVEEDAIPLDGEDMLDHLSGVMGSHEVGGMAGDADAGHDGMGGSQLPTASQDVRAVGDAEGMMGADGDAEAAAASGAVSAAAASKQKITLSADEYHKIVQSVLLQIRREERLSGGERVGMLRSRLIDWYLETLVDADAIGTEEHLMYHRKLIRSVLQRLVKVENVLLELRDTTRLDDGDVDGETEGVQGGDRNDPVLAISPGYYMDDGDD